MPTPFSPISSISRTTSGCFHRIRYHRSTFLLLFLCLAPVTGPAPTMASTDIHAGILPMQVMTWGQKLSQAFSGFFVKNSQSPCLHSQSFRRLVILYLDLNLKIWLAGPLFSTFITTSSGAWRLFPCLVSPSVLRGNQEANAALGLLFFPPPHLKLYFPNVYRDS